MIRAVLRLPPNRRRLLLLPNCSLELDSDFFRVLGGTTFQIASLPEETQFVGPWLDPCRGEDVRGLS
jgi:hypothetical protein